MIRLRMGDIKVGAALSVTAIALALGAAALIASCNMIPGFNAVDSNIYNQLKETTPVFGLTTSRTAARGNVIDNKASAARTLSSDNELYAVYYTLRNYTYPDDEGTVDRSNLYKLIFDVETVFNNVSRSGVAITPAAVQSPFSPITSDTVFDFGGTTENSTGVYKTDGDWVYALLSFRWHYDSEANKDEIGIAKFQSNTVSGDVYVNFSFSVDYDISSAAREYNTRCEVTGNLISHEFQFKYRINGRNIIAKGVSQGSGYMLFKYSETGLYKYIVVPAGSGLDYFEGQADNPTAIYSDPSLLPDTVSAYKEWVVSEAPFADGDMFSDTSQLTGGSWKITY
jgi:hypothetical protein